LPRGQAHIRLPPFGGFHSKDFPMSQISRRDLAAFAAAGAAAAALAASTTSAEARQPNMERAIDRLRDARAALRDAPPNKGGHKERAMELIDRAIEQVKEGIVFAERR
jgi:hypothetical protein